MELKVSSSATIGDFWIPRLSGLESVRGGVVLPGWSIETSPNPCFVEADLLLREGFDDLTAPIWFVAAPGAVGKSTLAKEISARTGAIYLDLAKAETVAGNYLTGGLVKNGLFQAWEQNKAAVLIDALDEARLRVTQKSFEDFLADVESLSRGRKFPTIIFGRLGIIEEAWLGLAEKGLTCPIFDIAFFDERRAKQFIVASLQRLAQRPANAALASSLHTHKPVYEEAAHNFVQALKRAAETDGPRFAGYAPVLEAVATVIAGVPNPARLTDAVQETLQEHVLQHLTDQILAREAAKLREQLPTIPTDVKETLYGATEQLARLTAKIYNVEVPIGNPGLKPEHAQAYDAAVHAFMPQHPFLDGSGRNTSGAVFGAAINAYSLFSDVPSVLAAGEKHAGNGPYTPNPFLIDFYLASARSQGEGVPLVPPEHVVALYESVRARASAHEIVRLNVEGADDDEDADVEIQSGPAHGKTRDVVLRTSQAGELRFGRQVNGVFVDAPQLDVTIGSGNPVELIAPVLLNIGALAFNCPELVVMRADTGSDDEANFVTLEARELRESKVSAVPLIRKGVDFSVSWPGAASYPWVQFVMPASRSESAGMHDALLALRRLVLTFRSHSKGRLARFKGKIEHARMTKGELGVALREKLLKDRILSIEGEMYFLDPSALGRVAGATYQDLNAKRFNAEVRKYVASLTS